jgi:hypothetical protein
LLRKDQQIKNITDNAEILQIHLFIRSFIHHSWSKALLEKPEGKRPLEIPRRRWVQNIRLDLREIGWDDMDWIDLADDRDQWRALVNTVMNFRVP